MYNIALKMFFFESTMSDTQCVKQNNLMKYYNLTTKYFITKKRYSKQKEGVGIRSKKNLKNITLNNKRG